jgi:thiosulfate/3-mercaptopyruvate sulfurtransferase
MKAVQILFITTLLMFSMIASAAPQGWAPLLEPAQLKSLLDAEQNIRVIQVTGDYASGHIEGSLNAPYARFRGPQSNPGELPPMTQLTEVVQSLGITANTPVVVVHQGTNAVDMGASTRVYWTLKSLGVEDLAILNGGLSAWQAAGLPISTETTAVATSSFQPQWSDRWTVHTEELETLVANGSAKLIDGRPAPFFTGQQSSTSRAGTIPGAQNVSFDTFFSGTNMNSVSQLQQALSSAASGDQDLTVTFCNSGHMGSINWFVMSEMAGMDNIKLYAESMTEWAASAERPVEPGQ